MSYNGWKNWDTWETNNMLVNVSEQLYSEYLEDPSRAEEIARLALKLTGAESDHIDFDEVDFVEIEENNF